MNKKLITIIGFVALSAIVIFFIIDDPKPEIEIGATNTEEKFVSNLQMYESKLEFSFQYPPHLSVRKDTESLIPERLFVLPQSIEDDDVSAIIISVAENDEGMTPLEWLSGPSSGADLSKEYDLLSLDGQGAISLDNGTWVVVNTPDEKYRLSIAMFPDDSDILFTEMGIIINSLRFTK